MPNGYSSRKVVQVLLAQRFVFVSQRGSHAKYRKFGMPVLTVIVPMGKRVIPYGTIRSILRQANLMEDVFKSLLLF